MKDLNSVTLQGNLTRDPELKFTPTGTAIVVFGLAVNHSFKRGNEWVDEANFFDVTAFGQLAENIAESLTKGDQAIVAGRLKFESWEDRQTGGKRSKVGVTADTVAASLARAVVTVNRNERRQPNRAPHPADQISAAANYDLDEEPF